MEVQLTHSTRGCRYGYSVISYANTDYEHTPGLNSVLLWIFALIYCYFYFLLFLFPLLVSGAVR